MKTFRENHYCSSSRSNSEPLFVRQLRQFFGSRPMSLSRVSGIIFLFATGILVGGAKIAWAGSNTITFDGAMMGICGVDTECCQTYTLIINNYTTGVFFHPISDGRDDGCIDKTCWENQSYTGVTFTWNSGVWEILFSPAPAVPDTINFTFCAPVNCWSHFARFDWNSGDSPPSSGQLPIYLCGEGGFTDLCGLCDRVDAFNDNCYSTVCFEHFSMSPLTTFSLHFNPPLHPCNFSNPTGHDQKCNLSYLNTIQVPNGWTYTEANGDGMGDDSTLIFTAGHGYELDGCDEVCISIPQCASPQPTVVTVTDGGYECLDSGASFPIPLKAAPAVIGDPEAVEQFEAEQNYPNPVDAASGFKTTIPFTTSEQGIAFIRIVNEKGVEVLNDNENVSYAGKHFFYIAATDLPAGTYYYQIEFPKGVVIQNRTMLVVK